MSPPQPRPPAPFRGLQRRQAAAGRRSPRPGGEVVNGGGGETRPGWPPLRRGVSRPLPPQPALAGRERPGPALATLWARVAGRPAAEERGEGAAGPASPRRVSRAGGCRPLAPGRARYPLSKETPAGLWQRPPFCLRRFEESPPTAIPPPPMPRVLAPGRSGLSAASPPAPAASGSGWAGRAAGGHPVRRQRRRRGEPPGKGSVGW